MIKQFYETFKNSYIQTFDDTKQARNGYVKTIPMIDYELYGLDKLNAEGAGIFFTPNPCEGGRKEENVTSIDWVYVDMDDGTKAEMMGRIEKSPLHPHIITETKRGYHLLWRVKCERKEFDKIIAGLIYFYESDPAITSTNEVLRLPPFNHMKDPKNPFQIKIISMSFDYETTAGEMIEAYPSPQKQLQVKHSLKDDEIAIIKSIPVSSVLAKFGVEIRRGFIVENGQVTSAHINEKENYINRFSGLAGSGSTIDAAMVYGKMGKAEAIKWLKGLAGIKPKELSPSSVAKNIIEEQETSTEDLINEVDKKVKVFTWGTDLLNKKITPIQTNHFIILAGNTGAGKTAFAFDVAFKNAKEGKKVLYLSLEMTRGEILIRGARAYAGITKAEWRDRDKIPAHKKESFKFKMKQLAEEENMILKGFPQGVPPTVDAIFELINQINPDITFIDNFDLIAKKQGENEYTEQTAIAKAIMDKCHDENRPVVVLHHKNPKSKNAGIAGNRGSGKIGDDSNISLACSRAWSENASEEENAMFTVEHEKCRDFGGYDIAQVYFKRGTFVDSFAEPQKRPEFWQNNI